MATLAEVIEGLVLQYRLSNPDRDDPSVLLVPMAMARTFAQHYHDGLWGMEKRPTLAEVEHGLLNADRLLLVCGLRAIIYNGDEFDVGDDRDLPFPPEQDPLNAYFPADYNDAANDLPPPPPGMEDFASIAADKLPTKH